MTISVRLNDEDEKLIRNYAELNNISISDLIRTAVLEKIENEYDREVYKKARKEFKGKQKTYSLKETKNELGLSK